MSENKMKLSEKCLYWINRDQVYPHAIGVNENQIALTADEFNRLAMQAPLVKRMVEFIKTSYKIRQHGYDTHLKTDAKQLLADIAELEEK